MTFRTLRSLVHDCDGATMIEYGLVIGLIAALCIIVVGAIGTAVQHEFDTVGSKL